LHHPNIVELIDYFTIDEKQKIYIVLEFVGGGTLQNLVERALVNYPSTNPSTFYDNYWLLLNTYTLKRSSIVILNLTI